MDHKPCLYLVRHGEAESEEKNSTRPLSSWGRSNVHKMAVFAANLAGVKVAEISHSDKLRSAQTAEIFAEWLSPGEGCSEAEGLGPNDDPTAWAEQMANLPESTMLVGHLPHLDRLASKLITGDADGHCIHIAPGGMVCLGKDDDGGWCVRWMETPLHLADSATPIA